MAASVPTETSGGSSSERQEFIANVDGSVLYDHKGVSRIGGVALCDSSMFFIRCPPIPYEFNRVMRLSSDDVSPI